METQILLNKMVANPSAVWKSSDEIFIHNTDVTYFFWVEWVIWQCFIEIIIRDQLQSDDDKLIHFSYGSTG